MSENKIKSRYTKILWFTYDQRDRIEPTLNEASARLAACGAKVVTIQNVSFGLSPMCLIYTIVYERDGAVTDKEYQSALQG